MIMACGCATCERTVGNEFLRHVTIGLRCEAFQVFDKTIACLFLENQYKDMEASIFAPSLVKGLTDKIYDRRKAAALEIER